MVFFKLNFSPLFFRKTFKQKTVGNISINILKHEQMT